MASCRNARRFPQSTNHRQTTKRRHLRSRTNTKRHRANRAKRQTASTVTFANAQDHNPKEEDEKKKTALPHFQSHLKNENKNRTILNDQNKRKLNWTRETTTTTKQPWEPGTEAFVEVNRKNAKKNQARTRMTLLHFFKTTTTTTTPHNKLRASELLNTPNSHEKQPSGDKGCQVKTKQVVVKTRQKGFRKNRTVRI